MWLRQICVRTDRYPLLIPTINIFSDLLSRISSDELTEANFFHLAFGALLYADAVIYSDLITFKELRKYTKQRILVKEFKQAFIRCMKLIDWSHRIDVRDLVCVLPAAVSKDKTVWIPARFLKKRKAATNTEDLRRSQRVRTFRNPNSTSDF
jgi:hypothetical protein